MNIRNAIIKDATITSEDYGILSAWVTLDYGGMVQGFGGYVLYLPKSAKHHKLESVAGHFIWRVMEIADVTRWENLAGKTVRVKTNGGMLNEKIEAIGHIVKEDWFCPSDDFDNR
jgi:hypothetical protein